MDNFYKIIKALFSLINTILNIISSIIKSIKQEIEIFFRIFFYKLAAYIFCKPGSFIDPGTECRNCWRDVSDSVKIIGPEIYKRFFSFINCYVPHLNHLAENNLVAGNRCFRVLYRGEEVRRGWKCGNEGALREVQLPHILLKIKFCR